MADPRVPGLLKHASQYHLQKDNTEEHLPTCCKLWEVKEPPSNMALLESKVLTDL